MRRTPSRVLSVESSRPVISSSRAPSKTGLATRVPGAASRASAGMSLAQSGLPSIFQPRDDALVAVAASELVTIGDLALVGHEDADELVDARGQVIALILVEDLDTDHGAGLSVGNLQRCVAHLAGLLAEDGTKQALLWSELGLALGRDLADQKVTIADLRADADDAALVQVSQDFLRDVRDVPGYLLRAELGVAGVDLMFLDVDRGEGVVMLKEVNQRGSGRDHLASGNIHVVHVGAGHVLDLTALGADQHALLGIVAIDGQRRVRLRDDPLVLFVGRQVVDLVGDLAVRDLAVRRLHETERVDASVGGERADQTDVRAFRSLDRAHAAVVRGVDVTDLHAGAVTGETARTECGQAALVGQTRERVVLVHEL